MNSFIRPVYRSTVRVGVEESAYTLEALILVIAKELETVGGDDIVVNGNRLSFSGRSGIFNLKPLARPLTRRNRAMNVISSGRITIDPQPDGKLWLSYELAFSETLVYVALVILGIAIVMGMAGYPWPFITTIAIAGLLWLILGNTIYAVVWFRRFLNRCTTAFITN